MEQTRSLGLVLKDTKAPPAAGKLDWLRIGFSSPRKANLTLYLMVNAEERAVALKKLGKQ